jgi:DNA-binding CsgD family transcriptional regulator
MGRREDAACLLGASDSVLCSLGARMPPGTFDPADAPEHKAALGDASYAAARSQGQRMTIEEVLATVRDLGIVRPRKAAPAGQGLTRRELETLRLISTGMTDAEAADALTVSRRTIHAHMRSIYQKIGVRTRAAATRYALDHGLA